MSWIGVDGRVAAAAVAAAAVVGWLGGGRLCNLRDSSRCAQVSVLDWSVRMDVAAAAVVVVVVVGWPLLGRVVFIGCSVFSLAVGSLT